MPKAIESYCKIYCKCTLHTAWTVKFLSNVFFFLVLFLCIRCTAIPYRVITRWKLGFPCEVFPHRENPVFFTWNPCNENRRFTVRKTSQGKPCFHYRDGFAVCLTICFICYLSYCKRLINHLISKATPWIYVQVTSDHVIFKPSARILKSQTKMAKIKPNGNIHTKINMYKLDHPGGMCRSKNPQLFVHCLVIQSVPWTQNDKGS